MYGHTEAIREASTRNARAIAKKLKQQLEEIE